MPKKDLPTPETVAATLTETSGMVYLAAEKLDLSASTVYRYIKRHDVVRRALKHEKGKRLDTTEGKLWEAILKGEAWAICFYLKTQGKHRGYSERPDDDRKKDEANAAGREIGAGIGAGLRAVFGQSPTNGTGTVLPGRGTDGEGTAPVDTPESPPVARPCNGR